MGYIYGLANALLIKLVKLLKNQRYKKISQTRIRNIVSFSSIMKNRRLTDAKIRLISLEYCRLIILTSFRSSRGFTYHVVESESYFLNGSFHYKIICIRYFYTRSWNWTWCQIRQIFYRISNVEIYCSSIVRLKHRNLRWCENISKYLNCI